MPPEYGRSRPSGNLLRWCVLILALDSATSRCAAGVIDDDRLLAARIGAGERNEAAVLPALAQEALAAAGVEPATLGMVAVTVGPGSFTGIRAALALAHGIALGAGIPVVGVTVGEAIAPALPALGSRDLWVATDSRRGRVFLEQRPGTAEWTVLSCALDDLPAPSGPVAVGGDAAIEVAARLAARDASVMLTDARRPAPRHIALAALARLRGTLPPRPAQPLYVDPPEARLPTGAARPAP
ncbi:MAG TPA: tRNA (adenosine(37)-N6)-threonylcarbamoyltransferase complex dimerization subunit type 1 TsaB [Acidisphaera sp.]|nr:tRNA (adenosine(37)-N6)-threonylcarbamoyltransferase complex dimerization subunit type 1 TsaB [Acidisphaera sp.]